LLTVVIYWIKTESIFWKIKKNTSGTLSLGIHATLIIRKFVIRGFDYPRLVHYVQNLIFADISLADFGLYKVKKGPKKPKSVIPCYSQFWDLWNILWMQPPRITKTDCTRKWITRNKQLHLDFMLSILRVKF